MRVIVNSSHAGHLPFECEDGEAAVAGYETDGHGMGATLFIISYMFLRSGDRSYRARLLHKTACGLRHKLQKLANLGW